MALKTDILTSFPPVDESMVDALLGKEIEKNHKKIVVLDDDPTGVQTVHDISVYTNWSKDSIARGFAEENKLFYILTNSRGFTAAQTEAAHKEIAANVECCSQRFWTGIPVYQPQRLHFAGTLSAGNGDFKRSLRKKYR